MKRRLFAFSYAAFGAVRRASLARLWRGGFALACLGLLAGCVDSLVAQQAPKPSPPPQLATNMVRRPGVSPGGASVAMASFSGGPYSVRDRFSAAFDAAAHTQDIVMATPDAADYLVRAYLNAVPEADGTALTYVLDIYDAKKERTQRVEDQILLKTKAPDPWSVVDDSAISAVAAKSAAALAAVLTNTPEAILAAAQTKPDAAEAHAEPAGQTIVAATPVAANSAAPPAPEPARADTGLRLGDLALH